MTAKEREAFEALREALLRIMDHACETYPHFESKRGQDDIAICQAALAKAEALQVTDG